MIAAMSNVPINTDNSPQIVLDLIYRLKVKDVMTKDMVVSVPTATMRELRTVMRDARISGVPISDGGRLVGIVSIEDIIAALDEGRMDDRAEERMTRSVVVLEDDMPLSFAITYLNRYKYGRFPVLDRSGLLVGIITPTDIIRTMLVEMNREVESLETMLKARIYDEKKPDTVRLSFPTRRYDLETAGHASTEFKKALKQLDIDLAVIRRVAVASYELELNQVIHSTGGAISMEAVREREGGYVKILAEDMGPGIPDLDKAMTEGYSTADEWVRSLGFGAGMGLPNARRVADEFSLDSGIGRGTKVCVVIRF